jgi:hypothetical protein
MGTRWCGVQTSCTSKSSGAWQRSEPATQNIEKAHQRPDACSPTTRRQKSERPAGPSRRHGAQGMVVGGGHQACRMLRDAAGGGLAGFRLANAQHGSTVPRLPRAWFVAHALHARPVHGSSCAVLCRAGARGGQAQSHRSQLPRAG